MKTSNFTLILVFSLFLSACGGGGSNSIRSDINDIREFTGLSTPTETGSDQSARAAAIVSRSDSLLISTLYGETGDPGVSEFRVPSDCSGTRCIFTLEGYRWSVSLSDLQFVSVDDSQAIGSKHDITLVSAAGSDFKAFGAWMEHSHFVTQSEMVTFDNGVVLTGRSGLAGGDLTANMPRSGSATWRGVMVGMPATGRGREDRLQGDALLEYDMNAATLDATFSNIRNIDRLVTHSTPNVRFNDVPVSSGGTFKAGLSGNRIQGGFYGPNHIESAGIFEQGNMVGAFGAKRQ